MEKLGRAIGFRRSGVIFLVAVLLLGTAYAALSRLGYLDKWYSQLFPKNRNMRLTTGDFPAGAAAPVGDIVSVPLRALRIGFAPRGSSAGLLLAVGATPEGRASSIVKSAYALDAMAIPFARDEELRQALILGGDKGGVDMAALSVDQLASWFHSLREASPRTELLLGRSRGQEALAALDAESLEQLRGKRIAVYPHGPAYYFALWALARAGIGMNEVNWLEVRSTLDAGRMLREGRADAAAGLFSDVAMAARDRGGRVLTTTADCPNLVSTVLVSRGDFASHYPTAVRRAARALLDAASAIARDAGPAAQLLGEMAPYLGDPVEAMRSAPPATLEDNLAFFGLAGDSPVTYDELFNSASTLFIRLGKTAVSPPAEYTRDLGPLRSVTLRARQRK
jgi:hypothetical protein